MAEKDEIRCYLYYHIILCTYNITHIYFGLFWYTVYPHYTSSLLKFENIYVIPKGNDRHAKSKEYRVHQTSNRQNIFNGSESTKKISYETNLPRAQSFCLVKIQHTT